MVGPEGGEFQISDYSREELVQLVETAQMYYEKNMTQAEIGAHLKVSRPMVSKLLSRARQLGIVKIEIQSPFTNDTALMKLLKKKYGINNGRIVPVAKTEYMTNEMLLNQGAEYILSSIEKKSIIGLGWGYTMRQLIHKISKNNELNPGGYICPLIGTAHMPNKGYHPNELVRSFSERLGSTPLFTYAPAFPATKEERELYMGAEQQQALHSYWEQLNTVILVIRDFPHVPDLATALRYGSKLSQSNVVGTFLAYYFTEKGEIIQGDEDYAIQVGPQQLRKAKRVIGFCISEKGKTLKAVLKTGLITDLIVTDKLVVEALK